MKITTPLFLHIFFNFLFTRKQKDITLAEARNSLGLYHFIFRYYCKIVNIITGFVRSKPTVSGAIMKHFLVRKKRSYARDLFCVCFVFLSFFANSSFASEETTSSSKEDPDTNKASYRRALTDLWNNNKTCYQSIHQKILPFAIYFPQFHEVPENNIIFYPQYTDMLNLKDLVALRDSGQMKNVDDVLTPLKTWVDYYDLMKEKDKIHDQVLTAKAYGIAGFALYHYWFSENAFFPNKHIVMPDVIDTFFSHEYEDFMFFFIWPTCDWCPALNNKHALNRSFAEKHFYDLLPYFKHKNYYKLDNRPVFFISGSCDNATIQLWNDLSIKAGFSGIYITSHLMLTDHPQRPSLGTCDGYFTLTPSWKQSRLLGFAYSQEGRNIIDYKCYLSNIDEKTTEQIPPDKDVIFNIFPNFDNTARKLYPSRAGGGLVIDRYTCINATVANFDLYVKKIFSLFPNRNNSSKIFLINSWNEWGENMIIEPSNERGFAYLECIQENMKTFFYEEKSD